MDMARFILLRLGKAILVILGVAVLNFLLIHLAPGDPAAVMAGEAGAGHEQYIAQLRAQFGLDRPLHVQHADLHHAGHRHRLVAARRAPRSGRVHEPAIARVCRGRRDHRPDRPAHHLEPDLPNVMSPIIVTASLMVATAILTESSLSFLGLGDRNAMSWGYQIGAGRTMLRQAWWMSTFPGIAILLTVLAINLIGEGLNDAMNPHLRGRRA